MLREVFIHNILYIDRLVLEFESGLNVLTGETGAGKSILLDALGFAIGMRSGKGLLQSGATTGDVTACFNIPDQDHPVTQLLARQDIRLDGELLLRRTIADTGRSAAFANGSRITADLLQVIGLKLVDIHGARDESGLLESSGHRRLLDDYAGHGNLIQSTGSAWRRTEMLRRERDGIRSSLAGLDSEAEYNRHVTAELQDLDLQEGEVERLQESRSRLRSALKTRSRIEDVASQVGMDGATGSVLAGIRILDQLESDVDEQLQNAANALSRALNELEDAQVSMDGFLGGLDVAPVELDRVEERLFMVRSLARKHNIMVEELPEMLASLELQEQKAECLGAELHRVEKELQSSMQDYAIRSDELTEARRQAMARLDMAMKSELAELRLSGALFRTRIEDVDPGASGNERITFMVSTIPGEEPGPINRIASSGETARFMLAIKLCLAGTTPGTCMIFDEIDRGVGGATASSIGSKLARLAHRNQTIVITHSPQVAAHGNRHLKVARFDADGTTGLEVSPLEQDERVQEIARMLSGRSVTSQARNAARRLLDDAAS